MSTGKAIFLDAARPHVALASYPRSGNSLTRALLENLTATHTGSDFCRLDAVKNDGVVEGAWGKGETVHDSRVWIIKTHSRFGAGPPGAFATFTPATVILLVRNPLRVAVSFWSFVLSDERQAQTVPAQTFAQFPLVWDSFVTSVSRAWQAFHRFWLARMQWQPVLVLNYEDVSHGGESYGRAVNNLHRFLYSSRSGVDAAEARAARHRASCLQAARPEARSSFYAPRPKSDDEGGAYTPAQRSRMLSTARLELCILGYAGELGLACSEEERRALELGRVAALLPRDRGSTSSVESMGSSALELNSGGCRAVAAGGAGPSSMQCPFKAEQMDRHGTKATSERGLLHHPFQALACVRQAARARGVNVSAWDHVPTGPQPPLVYSRG